MPGGPGNADGIGSDARFHFRIDSAFNVLANFVGVALGGDGNLYVANPGNGSFFASQVDGATIRKVTPDGVVTTLAGRSRGGARFIRPTGVAVDETGEVYVADFLFQAILRIKTDCTVTILAGDTSMTNAVGIVAGGFVDGIGAAARFNHPCGIALDRANNLYVADQGNYAIRKVTPEGVVTTLAGGTRGDANGTGRAAQFDWIHGLAVDASDNVLVADAGSSAVRKITPEGVVTTVSQATQPFGLALDRMGNLYVASFDNTVIKISADGLIIAGQRQQEGSNDGTGTEARFRMPSGLAVDEAGYVYVADQGNHTIRRVNQEGVVTTLAGSAPHSGNADGIGSAASFAFLRGVAMDTLGNIYVADSGNQTLRKVTPDGLVSTLAGSPGQSGSRDGIGAAARFASPFGVTVDKAGTVYLADYYNHTIRKVTSDGSVTTLAGSEGQEGSSDGLGGAARFRYPSGVAVDRAGNIYVADFNQVIRKITSDGTVTTWVGTVGQWGTVDGIGPAARFEEPHAVAVDEDGNIYVAQPNALRKITPEAVVTTLASEDFSPHGLTVDRDGNIYIADAYHVIRKVTADGKVTSIAGKTGVIGGADGIGSAAQFSYPIGIAMSVDGVLFIADQFNNRITKGVPYPTLDDPVVNASSLTTIASGLPRGAILVLESSPNLHDWVPVQTNEIAETSVHIHRSIDFTSPTEFLRVIVK
jgi:sugar lactone lactonase YvrE